MIKYVGIGEYKISNNPNDIIRTQSLATCVAFVLYDDVKCVAGLVHILHPKKSGEHNNCSYADFAVPFLIKTMRHNYQCDNLKCALVGGASGEKDYYKIGLRNIIVVKELIKFYNIPLIYEEIGGDIRRHVQINVRDGNLTIQSF